MDTAAHRVYVQPRFLASGVCAIVPRIFERFGLAFRVLGEG